MSFMSPRMPPLLSCPASSRRRRRPLLTTASRPCASGSLPWRTPTSTSWGPRWPSLRSHHNVRRLGCHNLSGHPPAGPAGRPPFALPALFFPPPPSYALCHPGRRRLRRTGAILPSHPGRRLPELLGARSHRHGGPLLFHLLQRLILP